MTSPDEFEQNLVDLLRKNPEKKKIIVEIITSLLGLKTSLYISFECLDNVRKALPLKEDKNNIIDNFTKKNLVNLIYQLEKSLPNIEKAIEEKNEKLTHWKEINNSQKNIKNKIEAKLTKNQEQLIDLNQELNFPVPKPSDWDKYVADEKPSLSKRLLLSFIPQDVIDNGRNTIKFFENY